MKTALTSVSHTARIHPLAAGAAASVMVLSVVGVGAITGILPSALSQKGAEVAAAPEAPARSAPPPAAPACLKCGTISAVRTVELRGNASGVGAVTGGVTGAVLGNAMGRGRGNTAMTLLGAAGGAFAGNEIEKSMKKRYAYRITVRMDDGSVRTLSQSTPPAFAVGDKVRLVDGSLVHA